MIVMQPSNTEMLKCLIWMLKYLQRNHLISRLYKDFLWNAALDKWILEISSLNLSKIIQMSCDMNGRIIKHGSNLTENGYRPRSSWKKVPGGRYITLWLVNYLDQLSKLINSLI
jgi:hypothetical protein